jgi:hypothetical protein
MKLWGGEIHLYLARTVSHFSYENGHGNGKDMTV